MRKALFWVHLVAGCMGGAVILLMSITGVLLMYERQILAWAERGSLPAERMAAGERLPVESLLARAGEQLGGLPQGASLTLRSNPGEPAEITLGREGAVYVSPRTGQVLGRASTAWRGFFQEVTVWHRWLGAKGENRPVAKAVTGACNLAFLLLVATGLYLWIPRRWGRQQLAAIAWFRRGTSGKARDFNWHNVFGLWSAVPLFFVVLTAVPMSYSWANDLIYRLTGSEMPAPPGAGAKGGGRKGPEGGPPEGGRQRSAEGRRAAGSDRASLDLSGLNQLWTRAESQTPGWRSIGMRIPEGRARPVTFTIDMGDGGQPQKRATLTLDRGTAAVVRWERFDDLSAGRRLRSWSRFVHTGEAYGIAGQTVAGVASAGGVMLVWTGVALALRRFAAWRGRKRRNQERVVEESVV